MFGQQPGRSRRPTGAVGRPQPGSSAVIAGGAVLALLAMGAVLVIGRQRIPATTDRPPVTWAVPPDALAAPEPIPLLSDPPSPLPSLSPPPAPAGTAAGRPVVQHLSPSPASSWRAVRLLPEPGARLSLVAVGSPGLRLRHQNFVLKLSPVGPRSRAADRADATFVLRRGLSDADCVSLESVNFPGQYVRHQNYVLRLQPRQSSALFAADATFCPRAVGRTADFRLRSVNFPDRYLTAGAGPIALSRVPAGSAQTFRAAAGL